MDEHGKAGRLDDVERVFYALLAQITAIHGALIAAAHDMGQSQWHDKLNELRQTDPLLLWMWQARNSDAHDVLVKWHYGMHAFEFRIVDAKKHALVMSGLGPSAAREDADKHLMFYVYEVSSGDELGKRMRDLERPSPEKLKEAGIEMRNFVESLGLKSFTVRDKKGKYHTYDSPLTHLGKKIIPSAHYAASCATAFYEIKIAELKDRLRSIPSLDSQAPE